MNFRSEKGSYTIEACISLLFFLIVIYIIFLQINTMIAENILQKSVNNFSTEISSFSYILDKANLIVKHDNKEMTGTSNTIKSAKQLYADASLTYDKFISGSSDLGDFVEKLYADPYATKNDLKSLGASFKAFISAVKSINWKKEAGSAGRYVIEQAAKAAINGALSAYCEQKTKSGAYLPKSYEDFCKAYHIDGNKIEYKVNFMPDDNNNTVFISVKCEINAPFSIPGFEKRTIVKTAYSPLWVK